MITGSDLEGAARAVRGQTATPGGVLAAVSDALVALHAGHFGKGAGRAKSFMVGDEILLCVMQDTLIRAEQTLVARGRGEAVYALRHSFHHAMEQEMRDAVERLTGRRVTAFMSQVSLQPDISIEVFFLAPAESPDGRVAAVPT